MQNEKRQDVKKKLKLTSFLLEVFIWSIAITICVIGLSFGFMKGEIVKGIIYSVLAIIAAAGLAFNIVYFIKTKDDKNPLPKE